MKKYRKYVTDRMWEDFSNLKYYPRTFESFVSYFNSLVSWIKRNRNYIDEALLRNKQIHTLLNIEAEKYVSDSPDILLSNESKRLFSDKVQMMDSLLMIIGNTLWELVKFPSGKNCPTCKDGGLDYVVAEVLKTKRKKIFLRCHICTYEKTADGTEYNDGPVNIYPANEQDLEELS